MEEVRRPTALNDEERNASGRFKSWQMQILNSPFLRNGSFVYRARSVPLTDGLLRDG